MLFRVFLILFLLLVNVPLMHSEPAYGNEGKPKLVYVLFDLSGSALTRRDLYMKWFDLILNSLRPGDRIIIEAIQTRSAINAVYPVNRELPVFSSWKDNALVFRKKMLKLKKEIRDKVKTFLDRKGSGNTEIMSAFLPAQQLFESYPEYTRKILVIMSDMIEESPSHNFAKYPPGEKKTMNIIATEKKRKCLPCLTGVTVYVTGAGGKSTSRMIKLKEFWLKYFNACGAEVQPGNYGAGLARFAE